MDISEGKRSWRGGSRPCDPDIPRATATRTFRKQVERARLEGLVAEAANARQRLEKMCRAFKDEIDTLNEALVIAARDIAEAADSELESEAERENAEDEDEDEETVEAYRRPPKDLRRGAAAPPSAKRDKKPATRFVVDPSGAYEAAST